MKIFAETERLILREILTSDVEGMYELDTDPEVHRYLGNNPISNRNEALNIINSVRQQYIDNGIGRWAIIDKKSNNFIGWSGLKLVKEPVNNHINFYDLGYRLLRKYWRQGVATETAIATLEYAFNNLNVTEIYAAASCDNEGSNKILKKVGLNFIETFYYGSIECNWYKIDNAAYENKYLNR